MDKVREDEEDTKVPNEVFLRAISSIDKITEELDNYEYEDDFEPVYYDESLENSMELIDEIETENILKTLAKYDTYDEITPLSLIDYDESIEIDAGADATYDVTNAKGETFGAEGGSDKLEETDSGKFVEPYLIGTNVEIYPTEVEQIAFTKAKSSKKSAPISELTRSRLHNVLQSYPETLEMQSGGGDTEWQSPRSPLPRNDQGHDEDVTHGVAGLRSEVLTPEFVLSACDKILDSSFKRRAFRDPSSASSTANAVIISSPDANDEKNSSSSSGFSEGACASDGSLLVPSGITMVHTLSESHVSTPTTLPHHPTVINLESPEAPVSPRDINSSCNSNSPEKGFPLQLTSANTDLLSASDKETNNHSVITTNNNNVNFDTNNINRNNNLAFASKSDSTLAMSTPPTSGILPVSSHSITSCYSTTTTDSTMYSAQDSLSFNTVVDSDDDYQNEFLLTSEFDSPCVEVSDNVELTDSLDL